MLKPLGETLFRTIIAIAFGLDVCAQAARVMNTIPLQIEGRAEFTRNALGVAQLPPASYSDRAGSKVVVDIHLVNMSNVTQTGTLAFRGSAVIAYGYTGYSPLPLIFNTTLFLCGNVLSTQNSGSSAATSTTSLPAPAKWSVGPESDLVLTAEAWISGKYGSTYASGGGSIINIGFQPAFTIVVDQDRGSLVASMTPKITGLGKFGTPTSCSGKVYQAHWDGLTLSSSPAFSIPINGGRGF